MCLYPKLMLNKRYMPTRKNGFKPPKCEDLRMKYVAIGCGNCIECRKQKAQMWRVRLMEELKIHKHAYFVTLTFENEKLEALMKDCKLRECNALAGVAVRRMLERYRKKHKKSITHWLITELGHENTERIHLHGIIFRDTELTPPELEGYWKYGMVDIGKFCNAMTINYIVKYVTKIDADHKGFRAQIFASKGIGKDYIDREGRKYNKFNNTNTREYYTLNDGSRVALPIYYRNHIYTEDQRMKLWAQRLDEHKTYVMGVEIPNIDTADGMRNYFNALHEAQELSNLCGYGDDSNAWKEEDYNVTLRMLNKASKK